MLPTEAPKIVFSIRTRSWIFEQISNFETFTRGRSSTHTLLSALACLTCKWFTFKLLNAAVCGGKCGLGVFHPLIHIWLVFNLHELLLAEFCWDPYLWISADILGTCNKSHLHSQTCVVQLQVRHLIKWVFFLIFAAFYWFSKFCFMSVKSSLLCKLLLFGFIIKCK